MTVHRHTHGAVLLELLVAVAIFTAAGMLTLQVMHNSYDSFERAQQRQFALDLARSRLAELQAGLISIGDLQDPVIETVGSFDLIESDEHYAAVDSQPLEWRVYVDSIPSEFRGLTLIEITVVEAGDDEAGRPGVTLRELVRLRDERIEEYENDDLLEGLPAREGTP